ncbi:glycosyltransferase [uncultured Ruegeria sp.]|uniref:glycosyltransferase family 2 protein n=1 Tax=uncultured Ruegeria sp. TaxID=259304 RepID=UPI00261E8A3E|nr:glycosyltransferase [uncultured Ruegeria sp.]
MTQPWLTVIMPIYNGRATLGTALSSLEGQSDGLEIIAVDQGSTDGSRELLEAACARLPIRIIDNPTGRSWTQNTNYGLREAAAKLITMLHQDDIWAPGRSALLKDISTEYPDVDLWIHGADIIDRKGKAVGRMCPPFGGSRRVLSFQEALSDLIVQNTMALPAVMFKRDAAINKGGLDEELWYTADWDLWLSLAKNGVGWDPTPAAAFRIHAESQTMTGSRDLQSFKRQLQIPIERHLEHLPIRLRKMARKRAEAANALNVCLASLHHRRLQGIGSALRAFVLLGPFEWRDFLKSSQIVNRLVPRLKLALKMGT